MSVSPFADFNPDRIFQSWWPWIIAAVAGVIYGFRTYMRGPQYGNNTRQPGKVAIVTGGNRGIGRETAADLAHREFRVYIACRDEQSAEEAIKYIKEKTRSNNIFSLHLDLASFKSIKEFVSAFKEKETELHVLVNNAGTVLSPQTTTEDGHESHFGVNYLGAFLLTFMLLDMLKSSTPSRIVNVVAQAYKLGAINFDDLDFKDTEYTAGKAYSQSKLALALYTRQLAENLKGSGVTVHCANPGVVNSDAYRHLPFRQSKFIGYGMAPFLWMFMKHPVDGSQVVEYCINEAELADKSGRIYQDLKEIPYEAEAADVDLAKKLYDYTMKLLKLKGDEAKLIKTEEEEEEAIKKEDAKNDDKKDK